MYFIKMLRQAALGIAGFFSVPFGKKVEKSLSKIIDNKASIYDSKPSQQQLNSLLKYYQTGRYVDAERLSLSITEEFPEHQFAWKVLAAVLKKTGRISESLIASQKSVQLEPQNGEAHYNLGVLLKELGRLDEAEISYGQAIALKPDFAEAHNNLGNTLQQLERFDVAEISYGQAIALKPDYVEAHYNLAVMLQQLERFDEAEISYGQAIALKPDYAEAHNNLGATLKQMGRLEEAMSTITKAIELNPHLPESRKNLAELLTSYAPQEEVSHPIVKVNQEIKKNYLNEKTSGIISDDKIIQLFDKSTSIIKRCDLKIETDLSQVYRSNSINLNCNRHMKVFNKHNIIPKFCFGCYKVLVEPRSILELIKLFVVFDQIKLVENNIRKCMIEMRPKISGFYKGYIFCSSLEEAYQMADYLEIFVKENIGSGLHAVVKRGCSEYPLSFPDYKAINKSGGQLMNYNEDWKSIEEDYDSLNSIKSSKIITPHLSGLNLQDVLIIRNWIDYAKGIGDPSVHLLNQNTVFSPKIYKTAKTRIEKYPW